MQPSFLELLLRPVQENATWVLVALTFIVVDVLVGFLNAAAHSEVSSSKMREGLSRKAGSVGIICVADIVDGAMLGGVTVGDIGTPILTAVCGYIAVMELISVLENICKLNPQLRENPILQMLASTAEKGREAKDEQ